MALAHVVITSVDRDDLPDFGAGHFARTIAETRARIPECSIEVLIPDFKGDEAALHIGARRRARRAESQHRNGAAACTGWRGPAAATIGARS